jgi:predicted enzyme related to lactoylglutathione lyase
MSPSCQDGDRAEAKALGLPVGHLGYRERVQIIGLDHVQVAAPIGGERDAQRFYGELLGLRELEKPEALRARGGVWFACGAHQLHVGVTQDFSPATKAHPALRVNPADLDSVADRLSDAGSAVQWDSTIPGTRRFYTADPWGNRIELIGAAS